MRRMVAVHAALKSKPREDGPSKNAVVVLTLTMMLVRMSTIRAGLFLCLRLFIHTAIAFAVRLQYSSHVCSQPARNCLLKNVVPLGVYLALSKEAADRRNWLDKCTSFTWKKCTREDRAPHPGTVESPAATRNWDLSTCEDIFLEESAMEQGHAFPPASEGEAAPPTGLHLVGREDPPPRPAESSAAGPRGGGFGQFEPPSAPPDYFRHHNELHLPRAQFDSATGVLLHQGLRKLDTPPPRGGFHADESKTQTAASGGPKFVNVVTAYEQVEFCRLPIQAALDDFAEMVSGRAMGLARVYLLEIDVAYFKSPRERLTYRELQFLRGVGIGTQRRSVFFKHFNQNVNLRLRVVDGGCAECVRGTIEEGRTAAAADGKVGAHSGRPGSLGSSVAGAPPPGGDEGAEERSGQQPRAEKMPSGSDGNTINIAGHRFERAVDHVDSSDSAGEAGKSNAETVTILIQRVKHEVDGRKVSGHSIIDEIMPIWWALSFWGLESKRKGEAYNYVVYSDNPYWRAHKVYELLFGEQDRVEDSLSKVGLIEGAAEILATARWRGSLASAKKDESVVQKMKKILRSSVKQRRQLGTPDWVLSKSDRILYKHRGNKLLSLLFDLPIGKVLDNVLIGWSELIFSRDEHYDAHPLSLQRNPPLDDSPGYFSVPDLEGFARFATHQVLGPVAAAALYDSLASRDPRDRSHRPPKLLIVRKPAPLGPQRGSCCHLVNAEELKNLLVKRFLNKNLQVDVVEWAALSSAAQISLTAETDIFLAFGGTDIINTMFLPRYSAVIIPWKPERGRYRYSDDMYVWFAHKPYLILKEFEVYLTGRLGNRTSAFSHDVFVAGPLRRVWYPRERRWVDDRGYWEWNRTDDSVGEQAVDEIRNVRRIKPPNVLELPRNIWLDADEHVVGFVESALEGLGNYGVRFAGEQSKH